MHVAISRSHFVGRNRPIVKSPSLNIEHNDVTDNVNQSMGGNDQLLLTHIEQQILNNESKCFLPLFCAKKKTKKTIQKKIRFSSLKFDSHDSTPLICCVLFRKS